MRNQYIAAIADDTSEYNGVAVIASFQTVPETNKPFHLRAASYTDKTVRRIDVRLSREEAQKAVADWVSMGLFGRHGRIETKPE